MGIMTKDNYLLRNITKNLSLLGFNSTSDVIIKHS